MVDVVEIGAGGGSIAHGADSLSGIIVGPDSAGSDPGLQSPMDWGAASLR